MKKKLKLIYNQKGNLFTQKYWKVKSQDQSENMTKND